MNKALAFVKLDLVTIKPYLTLKNLIILVVVSLILSWNTSPAPVVSAIIMMFGVMYTSYPFAVGEQNGIDSLYATLSITRNTVVLGRYLFALIINLCTAVLGFGLSCIFSIGFTRSFAPSETLPVILIILAMCSVIQAIQLPIYFKLGYAKAKFAAYLPFILLPLLTVFTSSVLKGTALAANLLAFVSWMIAHPLVLLASCVGLWLAIMFLSYTVSLRYYKKRDF